MHDPYAGHRNFDDPWWRPNGTTDVQWTEWDYILLEVCETIKMLQSPSSGQLRNLAEDPDVYWEVGYRVDYGAQELDRFQKDHEPEPGVQHFLTNPTKRDGAPFWTFSQWLEDVENGDPAVDREAPSEARPPTPEELAAIRERRARAANSEDA